MVKTLTKEDFIKKARQKHGDKYDYSKVEYINSWTKVCIVCPKHGEFYQTPSNHMKKTGCPVCSKETTGNRKGKLTLDQFIEKARKVHGDKYDYSKVSYVNNATKVIITCPIHGDYEQTPNNHLAGNGCPTCNINLMKERYTYSTEEFIRKAKLVYGDKYDYSKTIYKGSKEKVIITCPIHGDFEIIPSNFLMGQACHKCAMEKRHNKFAEIREYKKKKEEENRLIKSEENRIKKLNHFIEEAKRIHGDKYDYSKVEYVNNHTKVCIICPKHGEFWQTPNSHLRGCGCFKCSLEKRTADKSYTTESFIKKAISIHGDKYDYSKVNYINSNTPVTIICSKHGEFQQKPARHLQGSGCQKCSIEINALNNKHTTEEFIEKAKVIHGNKYDYSKSEYIGYDNDIEIICPKHGSFWQRPHVHICGGGCPICGKERTADALRMTKEEFVRKSKAIHGDKYDYSKVQYVNNSTKVCIICHEKDKYTGREHGEFWMSPNAHLSQESSCPRCVGAFHITTDEYIERAKKVHGDKYGYSKTNFTTSSGKIIVTCPEHGDFSLNADNHLAGNGCPACAKKISKPEMEIADFLSNILGSENVKKRDRSLLDGRELDIYIPSKKIAIEYDGLVWHSELFNKGQNYHVDKTNDCKKLGVSLIHIFEDEYLEKKDIVLNYLKHRIGADAGLPSIGARKCTIKPIIKGDAKTFLENYHIQGFVPATVYLGAFYNNQIVGIMSFKNEGKNIWNLTRFATNTSYRLPGLGSKLLSYFKKNYEYEEIKTFLDRRWNTEGNSIYEKLGFKLDKIEHPDYYYVNRDKRYHKFGFRKQILHKKYGYPLSMTEHQMALKAGFYRIWNCGLAKYVIKKNIT